MSDKFLITIPHSGEKVPKQTPWLKNLPEEVLMCDVDRYVDRLYEPVLQRFKIPHVLTEWHRYAADLNRVPEDVDASSVVGNAQPAGIHNRGFHWVVTTYNQTLMPEPMPLSVHQELVQLIYDPFHKAVGDIYKNLRDRGAEHIYHLDAHSMPSLGTKMHRDPGQKRADIVVSDCKGTSCDSRFRDLVIAAYCTAGFKVGYNWPYFGGRVTEQYGHPEKGQHALQVEMNRDLYMNEQNKQLKMEALADIQQKVANAVQHIMTNLHHLP